jgi:hypothetical protein
MSVTVPLATVEVRGIGERTDATLALLRTTGCRDTSGRIPSLSWSGTLSDGMRIALPHGVWDAGMEVAPGETRPPRQILIAGDPDVVLEFP